MQKDTSGSNVVNAFSRSAHRYGEYNQIQRRVAAELVEMIPKQKEYDSIVDIGCGTGQIYTHIEASMNYQKYIAMDYSPEMLALHPESDKVIKLQKDFNRSGILEKVSYSPESLLLSSSALQWCYNLDGLLKELSSSIKRGYFAVFTSGTFKTLHEVAGSSSPLYAYEVFENYFEAYYSCKFILKRYQLSFPSVEEMFRYIKKSGVSGGTQRLSIKQTKRVLKEYPLDYLEFEVLFVEADSGSEIT